MVAEAMNDKRELTAIEAGLLMQIAALEAQKDALVGACKSALYLLTDPDADDFMATHTTAQLRIALAKAREGQP